MFLVSSKWTEISYMPTAGIIRCTYIHLSLKMVGILKTGCL